MRTASLWVNSGSVVVVVTDVSKRTLHRNILPSISGLVTLSLLIVFILIPSALGAQEDPWLDSLQDAKGMKVGSRVPRFGDLERPVRTAVPETPSVETGDTDTRDQGRREATDPRSVDPKKEETARLIREWISTAKPPENAVEGNNVRYSNKGNVIGTVRGGVIESRHETGGIDPVYLWTNKRQLDSIDHCTMEEYVVARLKNESVSHCAGRYGAVRDLKDMRLADARAVVTGAGFGYSLSPGSPARTPEQEGTVEGQDPGPERFLKKGQTLTLTVRSPYLPPAVVLPDFTGKTLGESRKWLERNKLLPNVQPGSPAPTAEKSGTIEKQGPAPGIQVKAGDTVTLTVHSQYVDLRKVPDVVGLKAQNAERSIAATGLAAVIQPGGAPSTREQSGTVERQSPNPGATITPGAEVILFVYGAFVDAIAVPDLRGLSYPDSRRKLEAAGLQADRRDAGKPPERRFADTVQRQEPAAGIRVSKGSAVLVWVYSQYIPTREEQVAATVCSHYPGSRAYWDNDAGKPLCGCFDGLQWNLANTRCVTADVRENELCAREGQGLIARGRTAQGKINCVCPEGLTWNASQRACEKLIPPAELCSRNYPGSIPQGRTADGKVNCECPDGYTWNATRTGCEKQIPPQELCARNYPGSVPTGRDAGGKVNCECPQGYVWNATRTGCEKQLSPQEYCSRNYPGSVPTGGSFRGTPNCECPQGYYWEAQRRRCVENRGGDGDACNCVDERGRRYREAFGQACGTGGSASRDYNCSGRGNGDGNTQQRTPGSCYDRGVTVIHKLIDPPPYTGVSPICRDGSGKLWLQTANHVHLIERLVKGPQNRQTGCYEGSKVITSSRTYEGGLCGP